MFNRRKILVISTALAAIAGLFWAARPIFAQITTNDLGLGYATSIGLGTTDIRTTISYIIRAFFGLIGVIFVGIILYAGFLYMTAGGNSDQAIKARKWIINGTLGLIIALSAYAITHFILSAILQGTTGDVGVGGGPVEGGCPVGEVCDLVGSVDNFHVIRIVPVGDNRGAGWPKTSAIVVALSSSSLNTSTVTPTTFVVTRCNSRLSGDTPQSFNERDCTTVVNGTREVDGGRVIFKPNDSPGEDVPTDFQHDYWFRVSLINGGIRDSRGRPLSCPTIRGDISSPETSSSWCNRAMAFNNIRDVNPPTVNIYAPVSSPAYCPGDVINIVARADDDTLAAYVDFQLGEFDSHLRKLIDDGTTTVFNPFDARHPARPFDIDGQIYIDDDLAPGSYDLTAVAYDGVPQPSVAATRTFRISPPECCGDDPECGPDSPCGACAGGRCAADADCARGLGCDATTHTCVEVPIITEVTPVSGSAGTMVTIRGMHFGNTPGNVVFLGGDGADIRTSSCAARAWHDDSVVVIVPTGAVSGPLELITAGGRSDRTDDDDGLLGFRFAVEGAVHPGICYLEPDSGTAGSTFIVHGMNFGDTRGESVVRLDGSGADIAPATAGGAVETGWSATTIHATVPPIGEGVYPAYIMLGGLDHGVGSNFVNFLLRAPTTSGPQIVSINPISGPIGSYITITGSGFGSRRGLVRLHHGDDIAVANDPICEDNWHDNFIVIKIPERFGTPGALGLPLTSGDYTLDVQTAAPTQTSNAVRFSLNIDPLKPQLCSIIPSSGLPGTSVTLGGENLGSVTLRERHDSDPENSVHFYLNRAPDYFKRVTNYGSWSSNSIQFTVPGESGRIDTWPSTGPVTVVVNNQLSANSIPFIVQDCNASGASCGAGETCCVDGSCRAASTPGADPCHISPPDSAFGWTFSTSIIPSFPTVVRRAMCSLTGGVLSIASPTPADRSTDACSATQAAVEFNTQMDIATINAANVEILECGNLDQINCDHGVAVPLNADSFVFSTTGAPVHTIVSFHPQRGAYPTVGVDGAGSGHFRAGYWYQISLISRPGIGAAGDRGLEDVSGRLLDGDYNRAPGGDFVWTFKVGTDTGSCRVTQVGSMPPLATLDHQGTPLTNFHAQPVFANCNLPRCVDCTAGHACGGSYSISWSSPETLLPVDERHISLGTRESDCEQPVEALRETSVDHPADLSVSMSSLDHPGDSARVGHSLVTVAFTDPQVTEVYPTRDCSEACTNAAIGAKFNVPMDASTLNAHNVEIFRCRNSSCNPPFEILLLAEEDVTREPRSIRDTGDHVIGVELAGEGSLEPSAFFLVRIRGGVGGVLSASGVPLTGLNTADGFYQWTFRTRANPEACRISHTEINPDQATLLYVGQRLGLNLTAYGPRDACGPAEGQQLAATDFDWTWRIADPNPVLRGFMDAHGTSLTSLVDTTPVIKRGCTANCLLAGAGGTTSSGTAPVQQCGNGIVESHEDCDGGDGCSASCLAEGTSTTCGDGHLDAGENCEAVAGLDGHFVFPPGCKDPTVTIPDRPDLNGRGCVFLGSTAGHSVCGDGLRGDGEACDDGNRANGDGCSADCLKEGTLPACTATTPTGTPCVVQCGNRTADPGEDPDCDGPDRIAAGCSPQTCTKIGASVSLPDSVCGNGRIEVGEECDDGNTLSGDGCNSRCLLEGSSAFYPAASFCGDGIRGTGENPYCEDGVTGDSKKDPMQVVVSKDVSGEGEHVSTVAATVLTESLADENVGKSRIGLSCTCKTPGTDGEAYCAGVGAAAGLSLGCATSGCCVGRPAVSVLMPHDGETGVCRNAVIKLEFSRPMDTASVQQNITVARPKTGSTDCTTADEVHFPDWVALGPTRTSVPHGFLARAWQSVSNFVSQYIIRPVFGASVRGTNYCPVRGRIEVENTLDRSIVTFYPTEAFPASQALIVFVNDGAKSTEGVKLVQHQPFRFETGADICLVQRVGLLPETYLFSAVGDSNNFIATAYTRGDREISSTTSYSWSWRWTPQPVSDADASLTSPIVLTPSVDNLNTASARVRGSNASTDGGFTPRDGEAVVEVKAVIDASSPFGDANQEHVARANAVVLLCAQPWPEWQICHDVGGSTRVELPWDSTELGSCRFEGERKWFPFYDLTTGVKFYYCRDTQVAGDDASSLPAIRMSHPTDVITIDHGTGGDIFREYLFTFIGNNDAIGFRSMTNLAHRSITDWYVGHGFQGAPTAMTVRSNNALREGRTVYVSAGSVRGSNIYSNVYVFSYNDNAASETVAVFNQILNHLDFNKDLQNSYSCHCPDGVINCPNEVGQKACDSDLNCITTDRPNDYCDVPQTKLARDVKRWADLLSMRDSLLLQNTAPTLDEGTYLPRRTYSIWPSWDGVLASQLGAALPKDPLNILAACINTETPATNYNQATCWDPTNRQFFCGTGSRIYKYMNLGGQVDITAMFEYTPVGQTWQGNSCPDLAEAACTTPDNGCAWDSVRHQCNFANVRIWRDDPAICYSSTFAGHIEISGSICGDGKLDPSTEQCELGQHRSQSCTDTGLHSDFQDNVCNSTCTGWVPAPDSTCVVGTCGDGIIQPGLLPTDPEKCDDGTLNGTYGHCNTTCTGYGPRCGDGQVQPGEICDCGNLLNGRYFLNGVLAVSGATCETNSHALNAASCSWDCRGAAPHCGDGLVTDVEECDGGSESKVRGVGLCSTSSSSGDIPVDGAIECHTDADCTSHTGSGLTTCIACLTPDQYYYRSCRANDGTNQSCTWGGWRCTAPGVCGNGIVESGEQCDDGNREDNDACTNACRRNVCGDDYVNSAGGERCDNGVSNGRACIPAYGRSCNYCTTACLLGTVSGGYCGDGAVQSRGSTPPGPEMCEAVAGGAADTRYVCVSTRPEDQSFGRQTGFATCQGASCSFGCTDSQSVMCEVPTEVLPFGSTINNTDLVASMTGYTDYLGRTHTTVLHEDCTNVTGGDAVAFCSERQVWNDGTTEHSTVLTNNCDPDDDNDGVPDVIDVAPQNAAIHQAYTIPGTSITIPAATEVCDGIDNDGDGQVDNNWTVAESAPGSSLVKITGQVRDAIFAFVKRDGVPVYLEKMVCSNDTSRPCDIDNDCRGIGGTDGTCGVRDNRIATQTTDRDGLYTFTGIHLPTPLTVAGSAIQNCRVRVKIADGFKPGVDLDIPGLGAAGHPGDNQFEERHDRGYFGIASELLPRGSPSITEDLSLIPKPAKNHAIAIFNHNTADNLFLPRLSVPVPHVAVKVDNLHPGSLTSSPWAELLCIRPDGSRSCSGPGGPETIAWDWSSITSGSYEFYIEDRCTTITCDGSEFARKRANVTLVWCAGDDGSDCNLHKVDSSSAAPVRGGGKFWYVLDWAIGGSAPIDRNTLQSAEP